jgi:hypothetical protein
VPKLMHRPKWFRSDKDLVNGDLKTGHSSLTAKFVERFSLLSDSRSRLKELQAWS